MLADDLAQCFSAQLAQRGDLTALDQTVLAALPLIADKGVEAAMHDLGLQQQDMAAAFKKIRALNPRPASVLDYEQPRLLPPDVILEEQPKTGIWHARLNP